MSYNIITHDGKAHMDELLGSALLALHLGEVPKNIERMNAQEAADLVSSGNISEIHILLTAALYLTVKKDFLIIIRTEILIVQYY